MCEVVEVSCGGISDGVSDHVSPGFRREEYLRATGFFGSLKDVKVRGFGVVANKFPLLKAT